MITPYLPAAADAKLEDWRPLEEATGEPMRTSGTTVPRGGAGTWQIHETIRKVYVLF
jgi:hypothetical protein